VLELLDGGFRSGEQIEQATGVPALGFIPRAQLEDMLSPYALLRSRPKSSYGEAIRTLNWSISLLSPDRQPKSVLITSAQPSEGKTSIASSLALVQCLAGQRVLLVDADTRRPSVNEITGIERERGCSTCSPAAHRSMRRCASWPTRASAFCRRAPRCRTPRAFSPPGAWMRCWRSSRRASTS
jgi:hypothetical protein